MKYSYQNPSDIYCAPFLGNGDITLQLGPDGSMNPLPIKSIITQNPTNSIWWENHRQITIQRKNLLPFGRFTDSVGNISSRELPIEAEQSLDPEKAEVYCDAAYSCGHIKTSAFIHTEANLIALKKTLEPTASMNYTFTFFLAAKETNDKLPPLTEAKLTETENGARIAYRLTDRVGAGADGVIDIVFVGDAKVSLGENSVSLNVCTDKPCELTVFILLADTIDFENPADYAAKVLADAVACGYCGVKAVHQSAWDKYYAEGFAKTGDEKLDSVYLTAQYHLHCFTTRWSLPVGLNDATWEGKFFGFDEHYMQMGLITSNHIEASRRVPEFRKKGLWHAVQRGSSRHHKAAHYPWETIEDGTEASPPGFYYDHIFHMAAIPLSGWEYYRYTLDVEFLEKTVYPVLSSCAEYFRIHNLYRIEGGKLIVGKCTDLERLGSSVQNPYMTTCSVVATLRAYSEASRILGVNPELAQECDTLCADLLAGLPNDGKRYVPYPGCDERSISAFSGTYPFDVIGRDDPLQAQAIADYLEYEDTFGNMYATGSGVCSWYACWKAVVYDRHGRADDAVAALRYVAATAGDFDELFEINNAPSKAYWHPWFTTAAGMYIHAINEALLLGGVDEGITVAPGLTEEFGDFSFKLAARGGIVVECEVKDGVLARLDVIANEFCKAEKVTVKLPERLGGERVVAVKRA